MRPTRVFYGWWVALAFSVMVFLSTGIRFAIGPFLKPMVADLGLDRASYSLVISLGFFLYGLFMPLIGALAERVGVRIVATGGIVVFAVSVSATGLVHNLWQLTLVQGVAGAAGLAATGHVVGSAVISRWFVRRRATALSLLGAASMAGMSLTVPVAMWLILSVGWRQTYGLFGIVALVVLLPLGLWVVRESPESMGLLPDGLPPDPKGAATATVERSDVRAAVRALPFWQLAGALFPCGFSMSLLSAHGVPMLTDHGYSAMVASGALGVLGASSFGFTMVLGAAADRFGRRPVLAWLYATRAFLFTALFLVHDSPIGLLVVAALGGASMAGTLAMTSALTAEIFGRFSVGSVFGSVFLVHQAGAAIGSWLGGLVFELNGGYALAFTIASAQLLIAAAVSLTVDVRPRCLPVLRTAAASGGP